MISAIALTPIWNHRTGRIVQPNETFEMLAYEVESLIAIDAAKLPGEIGQPDQFGESQP